MTEGTDSFIPTTVTEGTTRRGFTVRPVEEDPSDDTGKGHLGSLQGGFRGGSGHRP